MKQKRIKSKWCFTREWIGNRWVCLDWYLVHFPEGDGIRFMQPFWMLCYICTTEGGN